jgi:hypothetical protein
MEEKLYLFWLEARLLALRGAHEAAERLYAPLRKLWPAKPIQHLVLSLESAALAKEQGQVDLLRTIADEIGASSKNQERRIRRALDWPMLVGSIAAGEASVEDIRDLRKQVLNVFQDRTPSRDASSPLETLWSEGLKASLEEVTNTFEVHRFFESFDAALEAYSEDSLLSVDPVLSFLGYSFYWLREPDRPLALLEHDSAQDQGPVVIGRLDLPMDLVGCGRWAIAINQATIDDKNSEDAEIVLALHRHSRDPADLDDLLDEDVGADFLAAVVLRGSEVAKFYDVAVERFADLG